MTGDVFKKFRWLYPYGFYFCADNGEIIRVNEGIWADGRGKYWTDGTMTREVIFVSWKEMP